MRFVAIRTRGAPDQDLEKILLADALFFPTTEALSTVGIKRVRFTTWLDGEDVQVWPAVQYSDDGSNWASFPIGVASLDEGGGLYSNTKYQDSKWQPLDWRTPDELSPPDPSQPDEDRVIGTEWFDCPGDFQDITQTGGSPTYLSDDRLFCRFGYVSLNQTQTTAGTTPPRGGRVALQIEYAHVTGGTLLGGPALCPSGASTASVFTPLTGVLATANLGQVRCALETQATDNVTVTLAYQTSNDGVTWSSSTALPGTPSRTADGISYPEGWTSCTVTTARYVRFGVAVVNTGGSGDSEIRGVVATVRVDWRDA